jgi:endoglucanase
MKLYRGINLGGYFSQCEHSISHYESFIDEADIRKIAAMGFDHVRLPIDYEVLEQEDGKPIPEGYALVTRVINWCKRNDLNVVLDLHKAYGYDFNDAGNEEKNSLFTNEKLKQRFVDLWIRIAAHFKDYDNVAFELLNEVVEKENALLWNDLIDRTMAAIHSITVDTPVIYGGIQWNSVKTLKLLDRPKYDNVIYTFHFYEPLLFTHQKAYWVAAMDPNETISYPESMQYYCTKSKKLGYQGEVVRQAKSKTMGPEFIREMVEEAVQAASNAGVSLYCGEFGVIDRAPVQDTLNWFKDVDQVFREYRIGCAVWSYKEMDFGLTGGHYDPIREELLRIWNQ